MAGSSPAMTLSRFQREKTWSVGGVEQRSAHHLIKLSVPAILSIAKGLEDFDLALSQACPLTPNSTP
jgi:hypothetical protein